MSGIAGYLFTQGLENAATILRDTGANFCGSNYNIQTYLEDEIGIVVSSRFQQNKVSGSFSELCEADRYVLAYEGYVVNLWEIARKSALSEFKYRGNFLIELYQRHGVDFFSKLNGSHNLVIWDKIDKICTLSTCKYGRRVLYTVNSNGGMIFGSEVKALRSITKKSLVLDPASLCTSFIYGDTYGTKTIFNGISRLMPATSVKISKNSQKIFYAKDSDPHFSQELQHKKEFYLERSDEFMSEAISRILAVDETPAVLMGSGVDSALIAAYLKKMSGKVTIVTQAMPGDMDESIDAARIAQALGSNHHIFAFHPQEVDILKNIELFINIAEEPAQWLQLGVPIINLSSSMRDRNVANTFLVGTMADNIMMSDKKGLFLSRKQSLGFIRQFLKLAFFRRNDFLVKKSGLMNCSIVDKYIASLTSYFLDTFQWNNVHRAFLKEKQWQNIRITSQIAQYFGMEVLFPYLDNDVVSHFLSLPHELKSNKICLRALLEKYLVKDIVPQVKRGYLANTVQWYYEADLLNPALDFLSERKSLERDFYKKSELRKIIEMYRLKKVAPIWHPILWHLLLFEMFCRVFIDVS